MKRIFAIILAALALTACGSNPVTLNYGDKENPSRVTSVTGLKSHDAANVMNYGKYTDAKVNKPQRASCSMKAAKGQVLSITGLDEFTCWLPDNDQTEAPEQADSEAMQAAKAFREGVGGTIRDVTPAIAIREAVSDRKDARKTSLEQSRIEAETTRQSNNLDANYQQGVLELLRDKIPNPPSAE